MLQAIDAYVSWRPGQPEPLIELGHPDITAPIGRVFEELCGCVDVMPSMTVKMLRRRLDVPFGVRVSYGNAAAHLLVALPMRRLRMKHTRPPSKALIAA